MIVLVELKQFSMWIIMCDKTKPNHEQECKCDQPEIRDSFEGGHCSRDQIVKCHGVKTLKKLEKEGKI